MEFPQSSTNFAFPPVLREAVTLNPVQLDLLLTTFSESCPKEEFAGIVMAIGDFFRQKGDLVQAESMYTLGMAEASRNRQPGILGEALLKRGMIYSNQGRWKHATADLDEGRRIYRQLNEPVAIGKAENILGLNHAMRGNVKQARSHIKRALQSFDHYDETLLSGVAQMNFGGVLCLLRDFDGALSYYHRAKSRFAEAGDVARLAHVHHHLGMVYLAKGAYGEALRSFEQAATLGARIGSKKLMGLAKLGKAHVVLAQGDLEAALSFANQSMTAFSVEHDRWNVADLYMLKGKIHREKKRVELAEWYFRACLAIHENLENKFGAAESHFQLGILSRYRAAPGDAREAFANSIKLFKSVGALHEVKRVEEELSSLKGKTTHETRRSR